MTKTKKIIIGAFLSVVTLGGLVAIAGPGHHGKFGGMSPEKAERIVERVIGKLDLNQLQKQNLNTLKDTVLELKAKNQPRENRLDIVKTLLAELC